jgi:hypothetical protein
MQKVQSRAAIVLFLTAVFSVILAGIQVLPVWFGLRRSGSALSAVHSISQGIAFLSLAVLLVALTIIAVSTALQPAGWGRKIANAIPLFTIFLLLFGIIFVMVGIGAGIFASGWLVISAVLAFIALSIALFRTPLSSRTMKTILGVAIGALALGGLSWLGTAISLAGAGGNPGRPGGGDFGGEGGRGGPGGFGRLAFQFLTPLAIVLTVVALVLLVIGLILALRANRSVQALSTGEAASAASPAPRASREIGRAILSLAILAVGFLIIIQLVPVNKTNPPVVTTIQWDSQQTKDLAYRACMDCHSNETQWPWYAQFAPGSWLTAAHVQEGRQRLNFSDMANTSRGLDDIGQQIQRGTMPPSDYLLMHPSARLTDAEKQQLIQGLQTSLSR